MSTENTYLALFMMRKTGPKMAAWNALAPAEQGVKAQAGMAAWKAWMMQHQAVVVGMGGPLGKTKTISASGVEDTSNEVSGYVIVRAASHDAAAKLFENHPHFTNFPGECVELMPVLPIPG
jgi:hypothetical protein